MLEKWLERDVPDKIKFFLGFKVFDRSKMEELRPLDVKSLVIGDIKLDDDELQLLKMNPKFAVIVRLNDEEMERDTEIAISQLRYNLYIPPK